MKLFSIFLALLSTNAFADGKITNADIYSAAAIAMTKLAAKTANNVCTFDGSGFIGSGVAPGTSGNFLVSNGTTWTSAASTAALSIGALDAQAANATGLALVSNVLSTQSASATSPGMVNTTTQTMAGAKTFSTSVTSPLFLGGTTTTSPLTLQTTSGVGTTGADVIFKVGNNGATEAARILNNGNVGIGSTAPVTLLDVNGEAIIRGRLPTFGMSIGSSGGSYSDVSYNVKHTSTSNVYNYLGSDLAAMIRFGGAVNAFEFKYAAAGTAGNPITFSELMTVTQTGNVGIGTSTPGVKTAIHTTDTNSTVVSGLRIYNGGAGVGTGAALELGFNDANANDKSKIGAFYDGTGMNMTFSNSATLGAAPSEYMRIDRTGNVGIGQTAPAAKLHQDSGDATATYHKFTAGTTTGVLSTDGLDVGISSNGTAEIRQREALPINFLTNNTQAMSIDSSGNVGIGTTTLAAPLDIKKAAVTSFTNNPALVSLTTSDSQAANMGGGIIFSGSYTGTTPTVLAYIGGVKENSTDGNYAGKLVFGTRANGSGLTDMTQMTIGSTGLVNILAAGAVGAPSLYFSTDTTTGFYRPSANTINMTVSGTAIATFNSSGITAGNVIATTSVTAGSLNVNSASGVIATFGTGTTGVVSPVVSINGGSGASAGPYMRFQKNSVDKGYIGMDSALSSNSTDDFDVFGTANVNIFASSTKVVTVSSAGVGIGTASPGSTLHVAGSFQCAVTSVSGNTTLDATHCIVPVDDSGATRTITLPACVTAMIGRTYRIKKMSASNTTVVGRTGSDTIDGATSYTMSVQYDARDFVCTSAAAWSIF